MRLSGLRYEVICRFFGAGQQPLVLAENERKCLLAGETYLSVRTLGIPAKPNAKSGMNPNGVPG